MLHAVALVGGEGQELPGTVGRLDGREVFVIASGAQAFESLGVVADDPVQPRIVLARDVGPQGVGRHRNEVQLLPRGGQSVRKVAVAVGHVAMVVHVAPEHLQVLERGKSLFQVAGQRIPAARSGASGERSRGRQAEQGPSRSLQKVSSIHRMMRYKLFSELVRAAEKFVLPFAGVRVAALLLELFQTRVHVAAH